MINTSVIYSETSRVFGPRTGQVNQISTAISKIGDASFVSRNKESKNFSPIRNRLFRESTQQNKGLRGLVQGEYHPLLPTHISIVVDRDLSPRTQRRAFRDSAERAKVKLDKYTDWSNYKLDIQLQLQNTAITKLNNQLTHASYQQPYHQSTRSAFFHGAPVNQFSNFTPRSAYQSGKVLKTSRY